MDDNKKKTHAADSYGEMIETETIRFERLLPGPIERVWDYLTDSDKRGKWLASGKMDSRVGGTVELIFKHDNLSKHPDPIPDKYKDFGEVSTMQGTITNYDPPHLLSYTWGEASGTDSEVTFELTEEADKVRLVLTHRKIGDDPEQLIGIAAGWHTHLNILTNRLEGVEPKGFWSVHMAFEEEYKHRLKL